MGQRNPFIYWKYFGKALNKHHDVNNMHGWLQKLFKSRVSETKHEKEAKVTNKSPSSVNCVSTSRRSASPVCSLSSSSSSSSLPSSSPLWTTPSKALQSHPALNSQQRWRRKYDVLVCHSSVDCEEAGRLVSFLEASPRSLRCFLRERDDCPGGAVSTELCQAVQNSHQWALLITPNFLEDEWCKYVMHQALAEGPMSNRIIPLVHNLSHSQYPQELKFKMYTNLSRNPDQGYSVLFNTVVTYLEDLVKSERTSDSNMDSSSNGFSEDSSKTDQSVSKREPADTSIPLELIKTEDESFSNNDYDHHQE